MRGVMVRKRVYMRLAATLFSVCLILHLRAASPQERRSAAAPDGATIEELPAGSEVILEFTSELSSATAKPGQIFTTAVTVDILLDDAVAIPKGAIATGHVTKVTGSGGMGGRGTIAVMLDSLEVRGKGYGLSGSLTYQPPVNRRAEIGAVALGGIVGAVLFRGRDAVLGPGRQLTAATSQAIPVSVPHHNDDTPDIFKVDPNQLSPRDRPR